MTIGGDLQSSVTQFLADLGRPMTLRRITSGAYDPTTGTTSGDVTADYVGRGRLGDYSDTVVNGTVIKEMDRKATFLPDNRAIVPQAGDLLGVPDFGTDGDVYTVANFKTREVGGALVTYTLQVRR